MGALLESGRVGNVSLNHLKTVRTDVINRWDDLGLLEGLNGHRKENIAQLFENQASYMLNETTALGVEGSFETVVFPIVRRVFSKLLANEIVSVQALNLPIGKLFYFVPKIGASRYDSTGNLTNTDNQFTMTDAFDNNKNTYDAFYGEDGMYDKSKGKATTYTGTTTTSSFFAFTPSGFTTSAGTTISSGETKIVKVTLTSGVSRDNFEHQEEFLSTMAVTNTAGTVSYDFYFPAQKYGAALMDTAGVTYIAITAPDNASVDLTGVTVT
jgi:hypothetical protein